MNNKQKERLKKTISEIREMNFFDPGDDPDGAHWVAHNFRHLVQMLKVQSSRLEDATLIRLIQDINDQIEDQTDAIKEFGKILSILDEVEDFIDEESAYIPISKINSTVSKPQLRVFISYAHNDKAFSSILIDGLRRNTKNSKNFIWEIWDDSKIGVGTVWDKEIQDNVQKADVAILLVSSSFLASDYIHQYEYSAFLKRAKEETNVLIIPILLAPCSFSDWKELADFQFFMPKSEDFGMISKSHSYFSYSDLVKFSQIDGSIIPNSQIERYHLELYLTLEKAAEIHFAKRVQSVQQIKNPNELIEDFNKERNHYNQIISNLEQKITQFTLRLEKVENTKPDNKKQDEREKIYSLVAKADIRQAISKFMEILEQSDNIQGKNAIIMLSGRYNELERNNMMNIISSDSYSIERNKISSSLLDLINTI